MGTVVGFGPDLVHPFPLSATLPATFRAHYSTFLSLFALRKMWKTCTLTTVLRRVNIWRPKLRGDMTYPYSQMSQVVRTHSINNSCKYLNLIQNSLLQCSTPLLFSKFIYLLYLLKCQPGLFENS